MSVKLGLKGEASARSAWHGVKKKLFGDAKPGDGEQVPATPTKPKTPRKPKATTPKSGKKVVKSEATVDDGDENDTGDAEGARAADLQDGDTEAKDKGKK